MIKLDIQRFGGRGASSSAGAGGSLGSKMTFNNIQKGDTFELETERGTIYQLKVGSKMPDGQFYVEGKEVGKSGATITATVIGGLASNSAYKNASAMDKQFMIPFSRTKKWKRK